MRSASIAVLREIGVETGGSNVQFAVDPEDRADDRHRNEPARVALLGAGVEGDRLPHRQGRGQARGRLHARRDRQRHHRRRHPGQLRADDRLCRHQDPALRLRKVQGFARHAVDRDEVGRRSHGDRPQLRRKPAKGAARTRNRPRPGSTACANSKTPARPRSRMRSPAPPPTACWSPPRRFATASPSSASTRSPASTRGSSSASPKSSPPRKWCARRASRTTPPGMRRLKAMGFSDARLAEARAALGPCRRAMPARPAAHGSGIVHDALAALTGGVTEEEVRKVRLKLGVRPVFKRIDSCAAEFDAATPYLYSTYEAPLFGEPEDEAQIVRPPQGRHPRRRPQPHRPGHRIRLLLLPRRLRAEGGGLRNDHGQLQPGDRVDRSRHLRPPLFRAADRRGRARNPPPRGREAANWSASSSSSAARPRSSSPPNSRPTGIPILGTSPDSIDLAEDRERFAKLVDKLEAAPARKRPRAQPRRGDRGRQPHRLSGAAAPELRARGQGDGSRRRPRTARPLHRHRGPGLGQLAGADRPLSARRDRSRRRRDLRRQVGRGRRHPPAYRGSRGPFGRQRLLDPALQPVARTSSPRSSARPRRWPSRSTSRADEHPVRGQGRRGLPDRGQSARLAAPSRSSPRRSAARSPRSPRGSWRARSCPTSPPIDRDIGHMAVKEAVFPFARFPGIDPVLSPEMKSTGEVMGISDNFDIAFAKSQLGGGIDPAGCRHGLRLGQGQRQDRTSCRRRSSMVELGFTLIATGGTAAYLAGAGHPGRTGQQGGRRAGRTSSTGSSTAGSQLIFNTTEGWQSLKDSAGDPRSGDQVARCHTSPRRPPASRPPTRSGRCAATRLKFARSNPIIPLPKTDFPRNRLT